MEILAAVNRVDPAAVRECIALGADVNCAHPWQANDPPEERHTALKEALYLEPSPGKVEIISILLEAGASLDWATAAMSENPPLCLLASDGDVESMKLLLQAGADVQLRGRDGSCLSNAVKSHSLPTVQLLLDAGLQFPTERPVARCFLKLALRSPAMLQLLMVHGVTPAKYPRVSDEDFGMLDDLILRGAVDDISSLVAMGFDPDDTRWNQSCRVVLCGTEAELAEHLKKSPELNGRYGWPERTLCELAVQRDSLPKLQLLLGAGAEPGERLLHVAAEHGSLRCLEYLIAMGLPLDATEALDETPLMAACEKGQSKAVKLLLAAGASVHLENEFQETALNKVTQWSPHPLEASLEILKLLHQQGADLNHVDSLRVGVMKELAEYRHHEAMRWMIAQGADLNLNGFEGTPLRQAVLNDDLVGMEILLQGGADPNVRFEDDDTVLFDVKSAVAVKLLLQYGADPNLMDNVFDRTAREAISDPIIQAAFPDGCAKQ